MRAQTTPRACARGLWGVVLLAGLAAGCSTGGKPAGRVSGTVSYRHAPVGGAEVTFYAKATGTAATAGLDGSGAFKFDDPLPAGEYVAYVSARPPEPDGTGRAKVIRLNVPKKYTDPGTSDLRYTVKAGQNDFPIELTD